MVLMREVRFGPAATILPVLPGPAFGLASLRSAPGPGGNDVSAGRGGVVCG